jgi:hypothetical protein
MRLGPVPLLGFLQATHFSQLLPHWQAICLKDRLANDVRLLQYRSGMDWPDHPERRLADTQESGPEQVAVAGHPKAPWVGLMVSWWHRDVIAAGRRSRTRRSVRHHRQPAPAGGGAAPDERAGELIR